MEPAEAEVPAPLRPRAAGQELGGEGRPHHGEAELPAFRHDDPPGYRHAGQTQAGQEGRLVRRRATGCLGVQVKPFSRVMLRLYDVDGSYRSLAAGVVTHDMRTIP